MLFLTKKTIFQTVIILLMLSYGMVWYGKRLRSTKAEIKADSFKKIIVWHYLSHCID